jgi:Major Facilitator Superfamily
VLTVSLSRITATMFTTSGVLLVLARTGSPALAGATSAAAVLPGAISGPLFGAWLDVAARRRVLIVFDQLTSVAALAALVALAGHGPNWTLPVVAIAYSVTRPFSAGSFTSALAVLAGPELLDQAGAVEATTTNLAFVVGPAVAAAIAGAASPAIAIDVQIGMTLVGAALMASNPAFEARDGERAQSASVAIRAGVRLLLRDRPLRAAGTASTLAAFGWGLMGIGFPLYAERTLHAGAHAGGYLWAAMAAGSIIGTFALAGKPTPSRVARSYLAVGGSALLWPLAHGLALGILLLCATGITEGPAYSGSIAIRLRRTPQAVRGQVAMTLVGIALVAASAGTAVAGAIDDVLPLIIAFVAVNLGAALAATRIGEDG